MINTTFRSGLISFEVGFSVNVSKYIVQIFALQVLSRHLKFPSIVHQFFVIYTIITVRALLSNDYNKMTVQLLAIHQNQTATKLLSLLSCIALSSKYIANLTSKSVIL